MLFHTVKTKPNLVTVYPEPNQILLNYRPNQSESYHGSDQTNPNHVTDRPIKPNAGVKKNIIFIIIPNYLLVRDDIFYRDDISRARRPDLPNLSIF